MGKVEVRKSKIGGKGVFSVSKIRKNAKVFRFSNNLIYIKHKSGCHCVICKRCINIKQNYWLYPNDNLLGWNLNHSCKPNCYIKGRDIFAFNTIRSNDEITIDYSTTNIDTKWQMLCLCGQSNCRRTIRSVQSLPLKLFNKYKGYMPKFIELNYSSRIR